MLGPVCWEYKSELDTHTQSGKVKTEFHSIVIITETRGVLRELWEHRDNRHLIFLPQYFFAPSSGNSSNLL